MQRVFVRTHHQITIPESIRKLINIQVGDPVELFVTKNKEVVMKPLKTIDPAESWFWSNEWQEKEKEADEAIARGDIIGPFKNAKKAINYLKKSKK